MGSRYWALMMRMSYFAMGGFMTMEDMPLVLLFIPVMMLCEKCLHQAYIEEYSRFREESE